jgi:ribosomal protein S18 acetylase RimI-like enzyme
MISVDIAKPDAVSGVLEMARSAYAAAGHDKQLGPFDSERTREIIERLVSMDGGDVLVARAQGKIVGMIALVIEDVVLTRGYKMAREITWWVDPDKRQLGVGHALMNAAAVWAKEHGASDLWVSAPKTSQETAQMCVRCGFKLLESIYVKGV